MERILTGQPAILTHDIRDADGVQVTVDDDAVTVRVIAGIELGYLHEGVAAARSADGKWRVTLPAPDQLGPWIVEWSCEIDGIDRVDTTTAEVVGGHLFDVNELREFDEEFEDAVKVPAEKIREARTISEDRIETVAGVAFVPRRREDTLISDGRPLLLLPKLAVREVEVVSVNGEVVDDGWELDTKRDALTRAGGWNAGDEVNVWYSHGLDQPPGPVRRAAMMLATEVLVPSSLPARATTQSTEVGTFRLSIAGRDGKTGIPEVDAVCAAYGRQRPAVG
ncbi:MAG: hypothetical protein WC054_02365 [Candidatus Nanopelagicales bacterium]